ncbi:FAD-dependent oxidoreductase [Brevibacterium ravenspurgense]|uniref:FAD-dependent oxidoreductase n=1 Tax=Brevibacterium ravenspurgense TaxID=479117 RepID=A0A2I1IIG7_9MICO|nr:geranylgeranyl reductase family protein [Brevibacterium ravenspurgense]PKY70919.1 FAD-dependent oxidoreductase [Brevibacterium ravenspurgense]
MKNVDADVVIVGAGPAGSAAAAHLAHAGLDVALLEKTAFPRDKICGDALTPRAVKELGHLGFSLPDEAGWHRNRGLRLIGGGHRMEIPWPDVTGFPSYGLTRARMDLDEQLARHAERQGAVLYQQMSAEEPVFDNGWIAGIRAVPADAKGRKLRADKHGEAAEEVFFRAPIVIAADGVSARTAVQMGHRKRDDRPMGVAVRTYYDSPRHDDPFIESWLELRSPDGEPMPGYGWLFPLGDGTVNVGLGILNTSPQFGKVNYQNVLKDWIAAMGGEWGIGGADGTEGMRQPIRSAALPMAFNRTPHFDRGVMLLGDAAGMVNPFNGEGIDYAFEQARIAAEIITTYRGFPQSAYRNKLAGFSKAVKDEYGSYFTLGRGFAHLIGQPKVMELGLKYGMGSRHLMKFAVKLLANLYEDDPRAHRDLHDRAVQALITAVPATSNQ